MGGEAKVGTRVCLLGNRGGDKKDDISGGEVGGWVDGWKGGEVGEGGIYIILDLRNVHVEED